MNPVSLADTIALLAFGAAFVFVLRVPERSPGVGRFVKATLLAMVGVYLFVSFSNLLEHAGIRPSLDGYEDFAEVLFVPLVAYVLYSRAAAERLVEAHRAEERIRSEHELLTSVVDITPAGILVAAEDGGVSFANDVARRMRERVTAGQLDVAEMVRSAPGHRPLEPIGAGSDLGYLSIRSTVLAPEGGIKRAVLVLTDVTDRVRNEAQLEEYGQGLERAIDLRTAELLEANRQLQSASRAKEQFLARMSHELRTPLNSILGFSEIMLKGLSGPLSEEQRVQLGMVKNSGTQLLGLVNNVLDMTRIEAGGDSVSLWDVDLAARVEETVASMSGIAALHGVLLRCESTDAATVETDPDKLDQIVRNLISNGIKFTDPGGEVNVTVTSETDYAVVSVADTGIGIPAEEQSRIFEAFQQVETPARVKPEGTGLGLAICHELCEILGCGMTLESMPGRGSTFTLSVPKVFAALEVNEV